MKKLILSTVALAALTFASCKKDNLQPTANNSTSIEQTNLETADDDKAVDARNKFIGKWKTAGYQQPKLTVIISKYSTNMIKIQEFQGNSTSPVVLYTKINSANKLSFTITEYLGNSKVVTSGKLPSSTSKNLAYNIKESGGTNSVKKYNLKK